MKRNIKYLFIFISVFILIGCSNEKKNTENYIPVEGIDKEVDNANESKDRVNELNNGEQKVDDKDRNEDETTVNKWDDNKIHFEPLENYKESSILSVYTQDNDNEYYCNALLNQDNEIEYYTVAKEEDGYYIWRYTLREGVTKEEAEGNPDF